MAITGDCDMCKAVVDDTAVNGAMQTIIHTRRLHAACVFPWARTVASMFGGFHPGFVAGPSAAAPCSQCGHKCAGEAPDPAQGELPLDDGILADLVARYLEVTHLPSLQERFARVLRGFGVRRRAV